MTEEAKTLTITLTGRPPVRVIVGDWPVIADAKEREWEGEHEFQAFRRSRAAIRVRRHADGRVIVHGSYVYDANSTTERSHQFRDGVVLEADGDIVQAIQEVARELDDRVQSVGGDRFGVDMLELGRGCIADLPAEDM